jgi:GDP-L-fucose synthase
MNLQNKNVVVTGANGLVGLPTVEKLLNENVSKIYAVDLRFNQELIALQQLNPDIIELVQTDLCYLTNCENLFKNKNIHVVLHLAGIKGSPQRTKTSPADYMFPMLMFNTNIFKAAFEANVEWLVYMSSVGVYAPADVMVEDTVWETMPSKNDWHPGWAKRIGELALDALKIQYNFDRYTIIRPSNIYGKNDNFAQDATVISSNIWKLFNTDKMICWGDGSAKRDFVFGDDVAQAAIDTVKKEVKDTINFGCGKAVSIKETIETIVEVYEKLTGTRKEIMWDTTKPNGDLLRCLSADKQVQYGIVPKTSLKDGIEHTVKKYQQKHLNEEL